jgi:hypothetical protein
MHAGILEYPPAASLERRVRRSELGNEHARHSVNDSGDHLGRHDRF